MEDSSHIDKLLRDIERTEKVRQAFTRSSMLRTLNEFSIGDPVALDLSGVTIGDVQIEPDQTLAGTLTDPTLLHMDVTDASNMDELIGQRIGLATDTRVNTPAGIFVDVTLQKCVAGNQEFAYYHTDDMEETEHGLLAPTEKIRHLPLRYGRLVVRDTVIFDFS